MKTKFDYDSIPFVSFKDKLPEIGQQIYMQFNSDIGDLGPSDCVWDGFIYDEENKITATYWKPSEYIWDEEKQEMIFNPIFKNLG